MRAYVCMVSRNVTGREIWYCNYCEIIVTNSNVKVIDENRGHSLKFSTDTALGFSLGSCMYEVANLLQICNGNLPTRVVNLAI